MLITAGCTKAASTDSTAEPASASAPSAPTPAAPTASGTETAAAAAPPIGSEGAVTGLETLMGKLAREARDRPKVAPTADDVLATFDKLGETIPKKQQSLADTYRANYCLGGYTLDGAFALDVCEYADAPAAVAGRELAKQLLVKMTTREVWAHKADTLAIVQLHDDAATTAQKKKLVAAFLAM